MSTSIFAKLAFTIVFTATITYSNAQISQVSNINPTAEASKVVANVSPTLYGIMTEKSTILMMAVCMQSLFKTVFLKTMQLI